MDLGNDEPEGGEFDFSNPELHNGTFYDTYFFYQEVQLTVLLVLFLTIVLGNAAVLVSLFSQKNRRTRINFFILQLALADLLVGFLHVLTDFVWKITIVWKAGNVGCKVIRYVQVVVTFSSNYLLVALSIDRYEAIIHPMNFINAWGREKLLISIAWVLSILFSSPIPFMYKETVINGKSQCWVHMEPWLWKLYMTVVSLILFFLPTAIIILCNGVIAYTVWAKNNSLARAPPKGCSSHRGYPHPPPGGRRRRGKRRQQPPPASPRTEDSCSPQDTRSGKGIIPRAKIKTIKMTLTMVSVFVACWSPYIIFDLMQTFGYIAPSKTTFATATFIQSLASVNSAANPFIYYLFSLRKIRRPRARGSLASYCCCESFGDSNKFSRGSNRRTTQTLLLNTKTPLHSDNPSRKAND